MFLSWVVLLGLILPALAGAQPNMASIHFDDQTRVFRIDAADMSYVLGINENKQVQTLYWGKRLSAGDTFAAPHSDPGLSSFDSSMNTTRLDFVAWGGGLYVEPDLKVTFPDGNRDLVLQYVSHTIEGDHLTILLKDISRDVYVRLEYQADAGTGILRRSAQVQNRTSAPLVVEHPRGEPDHRVEGPADARRSARRGADCFGHMEFAARQRLSLAVSHGSMGRRVEPARATYSARENDSREPSGIDWRTEQPVVRNRPERLKRSGSW